MRIARVFPRRTRATPVDPLALIGPPPPVPPRVDEVHISVAFTWDMERARTLAEAWRPIAPVRIGGPATGQPSGDFTPGLYLKPGYTITSRGCPNRCWFCSVWHREGPIRTLPIRDGWDILDDNLLACPPPHVEAVFTMLARQPHRPRFSGGLEAARLLPWHARFLAALRPDLICLAYDDTANLPHLRRAAALLAEAGISLAAHTIRCYILCGFPGDTLAAASRRIRDVLGLGLWPFPMLWRTHAPRHRPWADFVARCLRGGLLAALAQEPPE